MKQYYEVFVRRLEDSSLRIPKAVEADFAHPQNDEEAAIKALIDQHIERQATETQQLLFAQQTRLVDSGRKIAHAAAVGKQPTKAATSDARIAADKISAARIKLDDLQRTDLKPDDSRIFPKWYAPVMVIQGGQKVIKLMRYQCRPSRGPASYDTQFPGTFNARRDNLERFWRAEFGYTHGVALWSAFFENVPRHKVEQRELRPGEKEENVILEFAPETGQDMLVACIWSHWQGKAGEADLWSFAAITDEPPTEVAAAGHDRCIVPLKPELVDAWLSPDPNNLAKMHAILDDRGRPYYEHRELLAA